MSGACRGAVVVLRRTRSDGPDRLRRRGDKSPDQQRRARIARVRDILAVLVLAAGLLCAPPGPGAQAALLPELDTSSPAATYHAFIREARRIADLYVAYRADPTIAGPLAMARGLLRASSELFDLSGTPPVDRRGTRTLLRG